MSSAQALLELQLRNPSRTLDDTAGSVRVRSIQLTPLRWTGRENDRMSGVDRGNSIQRCPALSDHSRPLPLALFSSLFLFLFFFLHSNSQIERGREKKKRTRAKANCTQRVRRDGVLERYRACRLLSGVDGIDSMQWQLREQSQEKPNSLYRPLSLFSKRKNT